MGNLLLIQRLHSYTQQHNWVIGKCWSIHTIFGVFGIANKMLVTVRSRDCSVLHNLLVCWVVRKDGSSTKVIGLLTTNMHQSCEWSTLIVSINKSVSLREPCVSLLHILLGYWPLRSKSLSLEKGIGIPGSSQPPASTFATQNHHSYRLYPL